MASGATPAAVKVRLVVPAAAVLRALYDPAPTRGDRASGPCAQPVRPRRGGEGLRPVSPGAAGGGERTIAASSPSLWSQLHPQRAGGRQALQRGTADRCCARAQPFPSTFLGRCVWPGLAGVPGGWAPATAETGSLSPDRLQRFRSDLALCPRPTWENCMLDLLQASGFFVCSKLRPSLL